MIAGLVELGRTEEAIELAGSRGRDRPGPARPPGGGDRGAGARRAAARQDRDRARARRHAARRAGRAAVRGFPPTELATIVGNLRRQRARRARAGRRRRGDRRRSTTTARPRRSRSATTAPACPDLDVFAPGVTTKPAGPVGRGLGLVARAARGDRAGRHGGGATTTAARCSRSGCRTRAWRRPRDDGPHADRRRRRPRRRHPQGYVERVDGFAVAGVANRGTEALQARARGPARPVLLDIYLPDLGGLEVCRRLRAADNLVDVIAVTAARDVDTVKGAVGLGVAQYLVKPFTFATFRDKLERYAAYRALTRADGEAEQDEIDAMLGELRTPGATPLPKGLSQGDARPRGADAQERATTPLSAVETAEQAGPEPRHRPPLPRAPGRSTDAGRAGAQATAAAAGRSTGTAGPPASLNAVPASAPPT